MSDASFLAWCQHHGITTHGVQPGWVAEGWRGVIATQAIPPGSIVMSVPEHLLMSVMSARRDPQLASVLYHHQLNSHQILAIHLLHEAFKSSSSFWCAYIRQLPMTHTTFMCWPAEAVEALQLKHAQAAATAAADKSRREWLEARPALQQLGLAKKWCSLGAWHWAASCVLSRTMYHPDDPPCGCLTPLADLHNHAAPPPPYTPNVLEDVQQLLARVMQQTTQRSAGEMFACKLRPPATNGCNTGAAANAAVVTAAAEEQCAAACATETSTAASTAAAADNAINSSDAKAAGSAAADGAVDSSLAVIAAVEGTHNFSRDSAAAAAGCGSCQGIEESNSSLTTAALTAHPRPSGSSVKPADVVNTNELQDMLWGDGHYNAAAKSYNVVARCSYSPGDQVFLCYGQHSNLDLLETYGFLIPENSHEKAVLPLSIMEQALHVVQQQQHQHRQGERQWRRQQHKQQRQHATAASAALDVAAADCYIYYTGQPSWQLLKALRLAAASPTECRTLSHLAFSGEGMSVSSERTALLALLQACAIQMQQLPTTLEQDQALISSMTSAALMAQNTSAAVAEQGASGAAAVEDASRDATGNCSCVQSASGSLSSAAEQQQQQQCMLLSVQWRACYKSALAHCIRKCCKAVTLLEGE